MADIQDLSRRTLEMTVEIVDGVTAGDLDRPTPCAEWTLRQLLEHMIGQHHGFAAAARGETADAAVFAPRPLGDDPRAQYAAAVADVTAAFDEDGVLERRLWLPEIHPRFAFPAPAAIGFHLLDYVVHGWDVARAIGTTPEFTPDLLDAALAVAAQVPVDASRSEPGAAFAPPVELPADAPKLDALVASVGRAPTWPA